MSNKSFKNAQAKAVAQAPPPPPPSSDAELLMMLSPVRSGGEYEGKLKEFEEVVKRWSHAHCVWDIERLLANPERLEAAKIEVRKRTGTELTGTTPLDGDERRVVMSFAAKHLTEAKPRTVRFRIQLEQSQAKPEP